MGGGAGLAWEGILCDGVWEGMKPIHWRRTRLGRYLRHIPRPKHLRGSWLHRTLGEGLLHPDLWHPSSSRVAAGFSLGIFFAMMPMPFQMVPTIVLGYLTRVNLAAALVAVWMTNPITTPPVFFVQYKIGQWVLDKVGHGVGEGSVGSWADLLKEAPLAILCGAVISGVVLSIVSYPAVYWLWEGLTQWVVRRRRRCGKGAGLPRNQGMMGAPCHAPSQPHRAPAPSRHPQG